ncbi:MAG: hypothetical protein QOD06_3369 [Candidatus Binatota bacterium]|nr:hypothetical protein [Candidatus Binatota bacterium]
MRRATLLAGGIALIAAACGSARRSLPIAGPQKLASAELARGRDVFQRHCDSCHPGGEAGVGPAINDKPLPRFLIRFQVRHGLGAMPAFSADELRDDDLERLISYLQALRAHG